MKKYRLYILAILITFYFMSCGDNKKSKDIDFQERIQSELQEASRTVNIVTSKDGEFFNKLFWALPDIKVSDMLQEHAPPSTPSSTETGYGIIKQEEIINDIPNPFPEYSDFRLSQLYIVTFVRKPPLYEGHLPFQFIAGRDPTRNQPFHSAQTLLFHAFLEWKTIYSQRTMQRDIPIWASTFDNSNNLVAQAIFLETQDGTFTVLEVHYGDSPSSSPGTGGPPIYKCISTFDIDTGFKINEEQVVGKKKKEFFYVWGPVVSNYKVKRSNWLRG